MGTSKNLPSAALPIILTTLLCLSLPLPSWGGSGQDKRLSQEVADLRRIQEANSRVLAETVQNVTALRQEIQTMKGSLEELGHFFLEESQKNERFLREFDYRLTGIEERLTLYGSQLEEFLVKTGSSSAPGKRGDTDEDSLYRKALIEINLQNYKAAIPLFDQFIKKFPKSTLADNAQYWKGEALYAQKQYPQAVLEFQQVIKKYPKSDKVPAAILKQGYSFFELQNHLDSKAFLQKVIADFPGTDEAAQAKERIAKIDQILAKGPVASPLPPTAPR